MGAKKRSKRTVFVSAVLAMALSLTACASDDDNGGDDETTVPGDEVTTTAP